MMCLKPAPKRAAKAMALVLVLFIINILLLEIIMLSTVVTKDLGTEGVLQTQNQVAKRGLETAFTRLNQTLQSYVLTNGTAGVEAAFAQGAASALTNTVVSTTNPETSTTENSALTIDAWVSARRGDYYQISARARSGDVDLTATRWVRVKKCGGLITLVTGDDRPGFYSLAVDKTGRAFFGNGGTVTNVGNFYTWSNTSGLSTLMFRQLSSPGRASVVVNSLGRVFFGDRSNF
ncbi:MAG: hypothetical protein VKK59_00780, partial [Vampirovibrionales bacterium]|nr:hypothetical protein [Vampirovibrionales bacterium]